MATGFVEDAVVYGVAVDGSDGRAGMAALAPAPDFDLQAFRAALVDRLSPFARPRFLRLIRAVETTGTFKPKKALLVAEGFDPSRVDDPLFVDRPDEGRYAPLDEETHRAILAGRIRI
jgi:fatty-acyl-CoA synthase